MGTDTGTGTSDVTSGKAPKKDTRNRPTLVQLTQQVEYDNDDFRLKTLWPCMDGDPEWRRLLDDAVAAAAMPKETDAQSGVRVRALHDAAMSLGTHLVERLTAIGCVVTQAHAILHSDDMLDEVRDPVTGEVLEEARPKPLHIHMVIGFGSRQDSRSLNKLAEAMGVLPQYVEKGRRGGQSIKVEGHTFSQSHDNMLAYLIHCKYREKYQYEPEQVATVRGVDYMVYCSKRLAAWRAARSAIAAKQAKDAAHDDLDMLLTQVATGQLSMSQVLLTDHLYAVYWQYPDRFKAAAAAYGERRMKWAAEAMQRHEFATQVVYVYGEAGAGKTQFANAVMLAFQAAGLACDKTWGVYTASSHNSLDDYAGEELLLLDDLRASAMDASDWLRLLDPYHASPLSARYHNKGAVAPRLIVITSTIDPIKFFYYARGKGDVDEALDQFIRRLSSMVRVVKLTDGTRQHEVRSVGRVAPYQQEICDMSGHVVATVRMHYGATSSVRLDDVSVVPELLSRSHDYSHDVTLPVNAGNEAVAKELSMATGKPVIEGEVVKDVDTAAADAAKAERRKAAQAEEAAKLTHLIELMNAAKANGTIGDATDGEAVAQREVTDVNDR